MLQDPHLFWKNFRLGTELQISGSFIYNALSTIDKMETFYFEEECFEFLYNTSVGLERLLKICVILIEHDPMKEQKEFEKSLITHNHLKLANRIRKETKLNFGIQHNKFLDVLNSFYKSTRYDRFNISSVYRPPQDQRQLIDFIAKELKVNIEVGLPMSTPISEQMKSFIQKIIGKISTELYRVINEYARKSNIYTYELAYDSKAFKIFGIKQFDFKREKLMQREVFLFLMKNSPEDRVTALINTLEPLEFGQLNSNMYLKSMFNEDNDRSVIDEMEHLYEENNIGHTRVENIMTLGSNTNFDYFDDFDEED